MRRAVLNVVGLSARDLSSSVMPRLAARAAKGSVAKVRPAFPTAMHIAAYQILKEITIPGITALKNTLDAKSAEFMHIVKIGRTHFMDATPLTLGQEISGYASQLKHGLKAIENTLAHLSE